jgi:hypothetical protein
MPIEVGRNEVIFWTSATSWCQSPELPDNSGRVVQWSGDIYSEAFVRKYGKRGYPEHRIELSMPGDEATFSSKDDQGTFHIRRIKR